MEKPKPFYVDNRTVGEDSVTTQGRCYEASSLAEARSIQAKYPGSIIYARLGLRREISGWEWVDRVVE